MSLPLGAPSIDRAPGHKDTPWTNMARRPQLLQSLTPRVPQAPCGWDTVSWRGFQPWDLASCWCRKSPGSSSPCTSKRHNGIWFTILPPGMHMWHGRRPNCVDHALDPIAHVGGQKKRFYSLIVRAFWPQTWDPGSSLCLIQSDLGWCILLWNRSEQTCGYHNKTLGRWLFWMVSVLQIYLLHLRNFLTRIYQHPVDSLQRKFKNSIFQQKHFWKCFPISPKTWTPDSWTRNV